MTYLPLPWRLLFLGLALLSFGTICASVLITILGSDLPEVSSIRDSSLDVPLQVFSSEGLLIAEFGSERREPVPIEQAPQDLINALLASEDSDFFEHPGIELTGIIRALLSNVTSSGALQGASTITQQVARNFFLSPEQTYTRKIKEILLALQLEQNLTKNEILELYVNKIFLGQRAYGFGAAAKIYYGKSLSELSLAQSAMLAGLPKAPSRDNPASNPVRAAERRNYVLGRMNELGMIDQPSYNAAKVAVVSAQKYRPNVELDAPFVAEMVRSYLLDKYGEQAYSTGYRVYTTIKADLQIAADKALRNGLINYDRRHGYRGAIEQLDENALAELTQMLINPSADEELRSKLRDLLIRHPDSGELKVAIVIGTNDGIIENDAAGPNVKILNRRGELIQLGFESISWAAPYLDDNRVANRPEVPSDVLAPGDVIYVVEPDLPIEHPDYTNSWALGQLPAVSGALISMAPSTGAIQALSGGFDYYLSKYNRVEQAQRQPGSNIKPFIYAAAIDQGYTPASLISGAPIVIQDTNQGTLWRPENYSGKFFGPTRIRRALSLSLNLVSVRILRALGIQPTIDFLENIGIKRDGMPNGLSLALGAGTLSPMDMAGAYNVLANGGTRTSPHIIDWIEDAHGNIIEQQVLKTACRHCDAFFRKGKPVASELRGNQSFTSEPFEDGFEKLTIGAPNEGLVDAETAIDRLAIEEPAAHKLISDDPANDEILNPNTFSIVEVPLEPLVPVTDFGQSPIYSSQAMNPVTNYLITDIMKDVVRQGTATRALQLGRTDLAGKTGTTNDFIDAWFSGFNNHTMTSVWVGFDQPRSLGNSESGARAALPIWIDFMDTATASQPNTVLEKPDTIVSRQINKTTGKLSSVLDPNAFLEIFAAKTAPNEAPTPVQTDNTGAIQPNFTPQESSSQADLF
ncbi:MAG: penicillin-binding protein 1A [Arenicellaceae bacterium]|nr:penicillin-binding protein 1A [Arenicellaceae bacterium]